MVWKCDLNHYMFFPFYFFIYSLVLVSIEKIYQTLETAFHHISKHLEFRQKYSVAHGTFNSLLSVWRCYETLSLVFDILLNRPGSYCQGNLLMSHSFFVKLPFHIVVRLFNRLCSFYQVTLSGSLICFYSFMSVKREMKEYWNYMGFC